jgi:hypothetical protein
VNSTRDTVGAWTSGTGPISLQVQLRRRHVRSEGSDLCAVCQQPHPCLPWRRARARVLTAVRGAFTAGRQS